MGIDEKFVIMFAPPTVLPVDAKKGAAAGIGRASTEPNRMTFARCLARIDDLLKYACRVDATRAATLTTAYKRTNEYIFENRGPG